MATPIEQEVNGVENMIYMFSKCTNDGQMTLDVTFKPGTDLNMAQVLVQNRVPIAEAKLPEEVKRQGVTTKKKLAQHSAVRQPDFGESRRSRLRQGTFQVQPALSEQLCDAEYQGRAGTHRRRWRRHFLGPARLQHAHLARSGENRVAGHDARRSSPDSARTRIARCPPGASASRRFRPGKTFSIR